MLGYYLVVLLCVGLAGTALWFWRRRVMADIAVGAPSAFDLLHRQNPALLKGLDRDRFAAIYLRTEMPRLPVTMFGIVTVFLLATPLYLALLSGLAHIATVVGIIPSPLEFADQLTLGRDGIGLAPRFSPEAIAYIAQDWAGFYYFFGLLGFWILTGYVGLSVHHRRTPGTLREEIIRARPSGPDTVPQAAMAAPMIDDAPSIAANHPTTEETSNLASTGDAVAPAMPDAEDAAVHGEAAALTDATDPTPEGTDAMADQADLPPARSGS